MAITWADGFAHYGTGATGRLNMLDGIYSELDITGVTPETTNPPPGLGTHHVRIKNTTTSYFRKARPTAVNPSGLAHRFYVDSLPSASDRLCLYQGRNSGNADQFSITLSTTGQIQVRAGAEDGTVLVESDPVISAGTYYHFAALITQDAGGNGLAEVRINGETVIDASGLTFANIGSEGQWYVGAPGSGISSITDVADLIEWDDSGSVNNDFPGPSAQCVTHYPDADTATADWDRNTGSNDFEAIDDVTPDDDTTYIESQAAAEESIFELDNLPAIVSTVLAVITVPRMKKTDSGDGSVQVSMLSSDIGSPPAPAESNGTDRPITTDYAYAIDVHETDPATGVAWTPAARNAAQLKLERTL